MQFEDLEIWKITEKLIVEVYKISKEMRDYGFKDQIQRASISIANNISEGYERGTIKDKQRFLWIAKGSCGETRNMIHFGLKLGYLTEEQYEKLYSQCLSLGKMIYSFIKKIK